MDESKIRHHLGIWLALLVLLGLNIAGSFLDLGAVNPALTIAIAALQAFLIVTFFMYMRRAAPVPRIAAATGFFWLFLMIGLTMSDYRTRFEDIALGRLLPEPSWETPPTGGVPSPLAETPSYRSPAEPGPRSAPTAPQPPATGTTAGFDPAAGERVYQSVCIACHGQGLLGAPKVGDKAAWLPHFEHGMEMLVFNAVNGYKAMPPKGGHPELSEQEVRNAIAYMLHASGIEMPARKPGSTRNPPTGARSR